MIPSQQNTITVQQLIDELYKVSNKELPCTGYMVDIIGGYKMDIIDVEVKDTFVEIISIPQL